MIMSHTSTVTVACGLNLGGIRDSFGGYKHNSPLFLLVRLIKDG